LSSRKDVLNATPASSNDLDAGLKVGVDAFKRRKIKLSQSVRTNEERERLTLVDPSEHPSNATGLLRLVRLEPSQDLFPNDYSTSKYRSVS
jgi:hypothetical protein